MKREMSKEEIQVEHEHAVENAKKLLLRRAEHMEDYARKMKQAAERMSAEMVLATESSMYFGWAINDIENMMRNLNFAELARAQEELGFYERMK